MKTFYKTNKNSIFNRNVFGKSLSSQLDKKAKYCNGAIGLINNGNICYFNSVIQNLKNVYLLSKYLLSSYIFFDKGGFFFKYCELLSNLINQDKYQYTDPGELLSKLKEISSLFRFEEQNDCCFCIIYILNLLEKETRKFTKQKMFKEIQTYGFFSEKEKELFSKYQNKLYERRNSPIIELFYVFQENIYKCQKCQYTNISFQGTNVLNLPIMKINNKEIKSIEEAISYYQKEQNHFNEKDFNCPKCSANKITTQSKIISLPQVLIINLMRFGEKKIIYNHNVEAPNFLDMENLIMNRNYANYKYELIGFIKYIEEENSVHNIAICKNFFDNVWYVYDDSKIFNINNSKYISNHNIDTSNGLLFFYGRKGEYITEETKDFIIKKAAEIRKE